MNLISSIKLNKAKKEHNETKDFFDKIRSTIYDIIIHSEDIDSIYFQNNKSSNGNIKKAYLVLTGDNGLAGDYNFNTVKAVGKYIVDKENSILMIAGYMGKNVIKRNGFKIDESFDYFVHNPTLKRTQEMTNKFVEMYLEGTIDELYVIYTDMINSFKNQTKIAKILPLSIDSLKEGLKINKDVSRNNQIKYEPSINHVFNSLIPLYLKGTIYSLLVDAYACEQSSRVLAMDSATRNSTKIIKKLKVRYNRYRQGRITTEINEIISEIEF
jgi:F-type H+-transporting ATPase subunit gamma